MKVFDYSETYVKGMAVTHVEGTVSRFRTSTGSPYFTYF